MSIKAILAAASGGTATNGAIDLACRVASRFGAHLEGFHAKPDPLDLFTYAGDAFAMPISGDFIDKFTADTSEMAAKIKTGFEATLARHGITPGTGRSPAAPVGAAPVGAASASWREEIGYGPTAVMRRARFFDLVVLGRSERVVDQPHSDTVEQTLLHSGRPVLLAPATPPDAIGGCVALGWNGSPEAVRALVAALPFLAKSGSNLIVTVGDRHGDSAAFAIDYLAWHGIAASHRPAASVSGVGPGEQLLATARDEGADLLVMGGYGHMPWREFLFGGATHEITGISLMPLLLSH